MSAAALLEKVVARLGDCCQDELLTLLPPALDGNRTVVLTPSAMSVHSYVPAWCFCAVLVVCGVMRELAYSAIS